MTHATAWETQHDLMARTRDCNEDCLSYSACTMDGAHHAMGARSYQNCPVTSTALREPGGIGRVANQTGVSAPFAAVRLPLHELISVWHHPGHTAWTRMP